ncbi:MAG: hypothetical protein COV10_03175 [Candidatus Vogelbacteria bacterium CG10_big_fil_rev_8_21_14_0_10_51_16]|uniref:Homing endonuclease LAGLIDADG domain-containing protein n=1 Tax=Candidatus Vogelbacteria bacterium CG10_big_fil_rev_8_21_14_0_10_51_16 TaxID=1975045 RepID=A0A2H0RE18_9BACT|nr:MAG: hypothetical protein COV10_03175 [Candidatus Vogelbacteria bacterium CG10_big_fil_rev_8_21_14_0_10_51_16]
MTETEHKKLHAYVVGLAIGDGNLSRVSRAVKLRISCCTFYPKLIQRVAIALQELFPENKVSIARRQDRNCVDVICHSNKLENMMGWKVGLGPKYVQNVSVPEWILQDAELSKECL